MTYEVKLGNNLSLKMKLISDKGENNKEVIFIYEDNNCTYEGKEKLKYLEGTEDKQFFENKDNYKYDLEKKENENEIILFISKNNKKLSVSLKNTTTPGEDDIKEPAPINNPNEILKPKEMPTPNNNFPEEYIAKIMGLKTKYHEAIKIIKEENEKLIKDNEQLKKKIDEEKRKNDEIVKVFLENRENYELAVKKNSDITKMQNEL